MAEPSIFEKLRARKRMLDAAFSGKEPAPEVPPTAVPPKPKSMKRVPHRDPATGKIVWIDVPDE